MDRLAKLVTAALLLGAGAAHAFYAELPAPAGFSGSAGAWKFAPSAGQQAFGQWISQQGALKLPIPGTTATMPAAYKLAANAPRIAAAAIFLNPYVRTAVGIASWLGVAGLVWDAVNNKWLKYEEVDVSDGYEYRTYNTWFSSKSSACNEAKDVNSGPGYQVVITSVEPSCSFYLQRTDGSKFGYNSLGYSQRSSSVCPAGWYVTPAGCVQTPPMREVSKPEFEETLAPKPIPETVPFELPVPTPLPVEQPVINPEPGPNPQPRPLFVPTGDPVPNPEYDPNAPPGPNNQPYVQPGVRVTPSPTPSEPWRVDLQPVNRPVASPEPMPEPDSETPENPDKPSEEQLDFCAKNPDVLACQNLDEPASEELPASEKQISISPDGGWGADNASCPAPKQITVQGRSIPIPFDLFCTWASGMRPIIIAMAWLSAAFILLGARSES